MKLTKILTALGASLILIGPFTPAQATSSDVVQNLEGNPTCSSLGPNGEILEYRDTGPEIGPNSAVLPLIDGGTQTVTYTVGIDNDTGNAEVKIWSITNVSLNSVVNPINYTILKAQGNDGSRVFHFGKAGVVFDTEEIARGPQLSAISFCYGLTAGVEEPDPVPACEDLTTGVGGLDGTTITCDTTGNERLLINMSLNETNFGFDDKFHACTCNVADGGLPECNPSLGPVLKGTQDDAPPGARSCMEYDPDELVNGIPVGINTRVPTRIEGVENPDSYICYTIDGVRTCYGHY
jgi:hypothetical protein